MSDWYMAYLTGVAASFIINVIFSVAWTEIKHGGPKTTPTA